MDGGEAGSRARGVCVTLPTVGCMEEGLLNPLSARPLLISLGGMRVTSPLGSLCKLAEGWRGGLVGQQLLGGVERGEGQEQEQGRPEWRWSELGEIIYISPPPRDLPPHTAARLF